MLDRFAFLRLKTLVFLVCLSLFGVTVQSLSAQPTTPSLPEDLQKKFTLTVKKQSFANLIEILSKASGRNIVADDEPRYKVEDIDTQGTQADALTAVAKAFDYTWTLSKRGVILFVKGFNTPTEYPQVHLLDVRQITKQIMSVLSSFIIDTRPAAVNDLLQQFYSEFTPVQKKTLLAEQKIPASELTAHQCNLVREATLIINFARVYSAFNVLSKELEIMPFSYLQMRDWPHFYEQRDQYKAPTDIAPFRELDYLIPNYNGEERFMRLQYLSVPAKGEKRDK